MALLLSAASSTVPRLSHASEANLFQNSRWRILDVDEISVDTAPPRKKSPPDPPDPPDLMDPHRFTHVSNLILVTPSRSVLIIKRSEIMSNNYAGFRLWRFSGKNRQKLFLCRCAHRQKGFPSVDFGHLLCISDFSFPRTSFDGCRLDGSMLLLVFEPDSPDLNPYATDTSSKPGLFSPSRTKRSSSSSSATHVLRMAGVVQAIVALVAVEVLDPSAVPSGSSPVSFAIDQHCRDPVARNSLLLDWEIESYWLGFCANFSPTLLGYILLGHCLLTVGLFFSSPKLFWTPSSSTHERSLP